HSVQRLRLRVKPISVGLLDFQSLVAVRRHCTAASVGTTTTQANGVSPICCPTVCTLSASSMDPACAIHHSEHFCPQADGEAGVDNADIATPSHPVGHLMTVRVLPPTPPSSPNPPNHRSRCACSLCMACAIRQSEHSCQQLDSEVEELSLVPYSESVPRP